MRHERCLTYQQWSLTGSRPAKSPVFHCTHLHNLLVRHSCQEDILVVGIELDTIRNLAIRESLLASAYQNGRTRRISNQGSRRRISIQDLDSPVSASHNFICLSKPADKNCFPVLSNVTSCTAFEWPMNVRKHLPSWYTSQSCEYGQEMSTNLRLRTAFILEPTLIRVSILADKIR